MPQVLDRAPVDYNKTAAPGQQTFLPLYYLAAGTGFRFESRDEAMKRDIATLKDETFDLLVLGGGITGAGVALDAALRGLRVALIDKGDFASGTSSASSKLIHGGLRYLEHGGFHLVYEALHERGRLLRNACHLVQPLRFIVPFFRRSGLSAWKGRLGLALYDILAGESNIQRACGLSRRRLLGEFPMLLPDDLHSGAAFFDAQMDDARLCLEVLRTAYSRGARVANYVEATGFKFRDGRIIGIEAVDRVGGRAMVLWARQVVNACGPWVDSICRLAGDAGGPHLQPTKGTHLIVPSCGLRAAFLLLHPVDGRVFFVIPWMGKTLIGTTDTFTSAGPDDLRVSAEEITYLLDGHNRYFRRPLGPGDVLGSFTGLRPLVRARAGTPSALSREFHLIESPSGLLSAAGGKYTTYRKMAEEITDAVVRRLGLRRSCRTHDFLLDGTPREPFHDFVTRTESQLMHDYGLAPSEAAHLLRRYGRRAFDVADYVRQTSDRAALVAGEPDMAGEILYQKDQEMALFPADHLLRRMRIGMYHPALLQSATS
jgi:glycerol-3-phosphate dehydrogenase